MKVLLDTNILLDYLLGRSDFVEPATQLLLIGNAKLISLLVTDLTIANIAYVTRSDIPKEDFYRVMRKLSMCYEIIPIGREAVNMALEAQWNDFEDALQYYAALNAEADCIVTRNVKDFANSSIVVKTPTQFLETEVIHLP